jgi:hypothetical protein
MKPKWLLLAADLLDMASSEFANHGCNDFDTPEGWSAAEVEEFGKALEDWNSDGGNFDPDNPLVMDYMAMGFLAAKLREEVGNL